MSIRSDDLLWYKDAVIYQAHVRTFFDGNGDGMGDFAGLTEKLDYLEDLGVNAIWILPFYPSPWKDDGYDIADYAGVHPAYGTIADFKAFLKEAHRRGIRVVTELVINHTSDQHAWFQRARRAKKGSAAREFYVWTDDPDKYKDARIIFQDFENSNWTWDPVAHQYFWHRFYSQQPDLNFENPAVHTAVIKALDFWFRMGVDGMRLDAIPYLYEREGTNCENLPETHAFLKKLRAHVDAHWPGRMLLAEANQWPEDAVEYFGDGDECHMSFHFPVMPRLYMAVQMEDRFPVIDILEQTPPIPETCHWAMFLRNHDELTLEMVTDEERDYMYRAYAQDRQMRVNLGIRRRLAPLMQNDRRRIELMNGLLFALPGTPIIYYGDEIGMGDNVWLGDRNGVRTPMQWTADRNAGFSPVNPHKLFLPVIIDPQYHYELLNVEAQQENASSLLWWMKRMIATRKRHRAFSRGTMEFLEPENRKVLAFVREIGDERILCVFNLSRFAQPVELDLSRWQGLRPVELTGGTAWPLLADGRFHLALNSYGFFWFSLEPDRVMEGLDPSHAIGEPPVLALSEHWHSLVDGDSRHDLEEVLVRYLPHLRWFGGKARRIRSVRIEEAVPVRAGGRAYLAFLRVTYMDESQELYQLPLTVSSGEAAERVLREHPAMAIARLRPVRGEELLLHDAVAEPQFAGAMLDIIDRRRDLRGAEGTLAGQRLDAYRRLLEPGGTPTANGTGGPPSKTRRTKTIKEPIPESPRRLDARILGAEQSNTSIVFGDRLILKLFRRPDEGINPDLEVSSFLNEHGFESTPAVAGALAYRRETGESITLGILQGLVENEGDAWTYTLDEVSRFYDRVLTTDAAPPDARLGSRALIAESRSEPEPQEAELVGYYLPAVRLLGQRTAEMHRVLASAAPDEKAFAAEPFGELYQRSLYQSMRNLTRRNLEVLANRLDTLPAAARAGAEEVRAAQEAILDRFRAVVGRKLRTSRTRIHGDYHLGQVLYTGSDFVIIDFEGEPARSLSERRIKRSPLADVAGMLRSFHYAAWSGLFRQLDAERVPEPRREEMQVWARYWSNRVSGAFLASYLETGRDAGFLPPSDDELALLLDIFLLEKAIYELGYELNNRPTWVGIPVQGILELLRGGAE